MKRLTWWLEERVPHDPRWYRFIDGHSLRAIRSDLHWMREHALRKRTGRQYRIRIGWEEDD